FDPGPAGLVFELPEAAQGAQFAGEPRPGVTLDGNKVTVRTTLPPGELAVSFGFVLPRRGKEVELRQRLPVASNQLVVIADRFPDMEVGGNVAQKTERELEGRSFWLLMLPPLGAGDELEVRLGNLPHRSELPRNLAVVLALLL